MIVEIVAVTALLDVAATVADVIYTEQGLHKTSYTEGNEFVGDRPSTFRLYAWNFGFIAVVSSALLCPIHSLGVGAAVLLSIDAVKHVMGVRKWKAALAGKPLPVQSSIWRKFLGF